MAERKRWDKQQDFHPRLDGGSSNPDKADPVLTKQMQYIKVLEERNRVKKRLAAASKRNDRLQEREEAFVTAFNVPPRAAQSTSASLASRNTRSATSVLPTKLPGKREEAKLSKCRSAPSTTLNFASASAGGEEEKAVEQNRVRRAKWDRPQAPMAVAVEHQDGVPLFRLTTRSEEKGDEDEEESYLEESFEDFEEDEESESSRDGRAEAVKELVIDEGDEDVEALKSAVDLSKTTKELLGIIQHLSRSKQKALAGVLQKFQSSEQDEDDVKKLQSSIGDPAIWKEITATLSPSSATEQVVGTRKVPVALENHQRPAVAPLKNLLEEQLRWEDEYAHEMKERLAREREEKQRMLKEAEERRAKMMKQLEDEEREIERLMEGKRQERLAKLRALQEETVADEAGDSRQKMDVKHSLDGQIVPTESVKTEAKVTEARRSSDLDEASLAADTKSASSEDTKDPTARQEAVPVIPRLKLAFDSDSGALTSAERYEIHVKLLSTWGKTRAVGLTQICAYDLNGEELSVDLESLRLHDQPSGRALPKTNDMVRGLQRLFNGVAHTNSEKDMWLGRLGDSGVLLVAFEVLAVPSKLCIWNYNNRMSTACTRDIEVCVGGKCVWTGSLPEAFGDQDDNACTWIDLLGTSRKATARTARLGESAVSAARSDVKASAQWAETRRSTQQPTLLVDETRSDKPTGSTPLWLTSGVSSSPSTERLPRTSRSNADLDVWAADEKPAAGSLTSRRRQGKSLYSTQNALDSVKYEPTDEKQTHQAETKYTSSREDDNLEEGKSRDEQKLVAPALSSLSSWDSLEKFSKTNRSRLPQPTDTIESSVDAGYDSLEAKAKPSTSRTSFTTSTLLTELRQGTLMSNYTASASVSPASVVPGALASDPLINSNTGTATTTDIPVLPSGKWLQIVILSTWGDPYYVGLNGVEIFDHHGELVQFQDPARQVTACPESINVLEENTDDPRVPRNLVDGVNFTCDDFHMWLAPYTPGESHYVLIELGSSVAVSMVRIWNYNKSRTHTCRGVREARLVLSTGCDEPGKVIFEGEIRQAPGLVGADSMELSNEVILFTQESEILEAIETNDEALRAIAREQQREDEETREIVASVHRSMELQRPRTSDSGSRSVEKSPKNQETDEDEQRRLRVGQDGRPMTTATRSVANSSRLRTPIDSWVAEEPQQRSPDAAKMSEGVSGMAQSSDALTDENLPFGRRLTVYLHTTWGDRNYVGLTQIEVLVGSRGAPIPLNISDLDATPRDLASLGYVGDPRTLEKLIDGEATTCDDTHMWLVPLEAGAVPEIRIAFKQPQYFYGLRVWNYNKSPEDTFRGAKQLVVALDGVVISPKETGFLLRKAPGVADFDFGQLLRFPESNEEAKKSSSNSIAAYSERVRYPFNARAYKTPIVRQDYEAPLYPQGFLLKIVCWTTWGDPYYLGLNGVELYDFAGCKIVEKPNVIHAVPYSVSELDDVSGRQQDTRTPDNLVSGLDKNTWEAHDAWLAPLASSLGNSNGNVVYLGFDTPVVLSMIKFWNYSKTPERGVKDIDIYLDDMHLFSGTLRKAPEGEKYGSSKHKVTERFGQPVLFSSSQAQVDAEKRYVSYCGMEEQDVLAINEGQVMQESLAMYRKPDPGAEGVVVDLELRPMTAVCRQ